MHSLVSSSISKAWIALSHRCIKKALNRNIDDSDEVYKSMIRPVMMYGAEAWTLTRKEEELLERAEIECYDGY